MVVARLSSGLNQGSRKLSRLGIAHTLKELDIFCNMIINII